MYYVFQNIDFVLNLQNRAFPKRVVSIFDLRVKSSNARGCQFRFRMKVSGGGILIIFQNMNI